MEVLGLCVMGARDARNGRWGYMNVGEAGVYRLA